MAGVPFFISGAGRSGSTYLYQLLRAHPKIAITNEARIIDALWRSYQSVALPYGEAAPGGIQGVVDPKTLPLLGNVFSSHLLVILEEYYRRRFGNGFTHFGDKLPDHVAVGMAARAYPEVRLLAVARDPRDVICSYRAVSGRNGGSGFREVGLQGFTVEDLARIWRETYEFLFETAPRIHIVRYVDLVQDPAQTVGEALAHLGLDPHDELDAAIRGNDTFATHGSSATPTDSIGRWRRELTHGEAESVAHSCGAMTFRLGLAERAAKERGHR